MRVYHNASLKSYHTFGIEQSCSTLIEVESIDDICSIYRSKEWQGQPKLMLGKGSNVLFTQPYQGVVLINKLKGIIIDQDDQCYRLHVSGGEDWHERSYNFSGAGVSDSGALFAYHGNWGAPGRWSVEVLTSAHPSPLASKGSFAKDGFLGCNHFNLINQELQKQGKTEINWNLPT